MSRCSVAVLRANACRLFSSTFLCLTSLGSALRICVNAKFVLQTRKIDIFHVLFNVFYVPLKDVTTMDLSVYYTVNVWWKWQKSWHDPVKRNSLNSMCVFHNRENQDCTLIWKYEKWIRKFATVHCTVHTIYLVFLIMPFSSFIHLDEYLHGWLFLSLYSSWQKSINVTWKTKSTHSQSHSFTKPQHQEMHKIFM